MNDKKTTYREHTDMENTLKLRQVLATLPPFCRDYFRAIDTTTTAKTRISYAYDIRIFFQFLLDENPAFKDYSMTDFTVDVLDQIKAVDLAGFGDNLFNSIRQVSCCSRANLSRSNIMRIVLIPGVCSQIFC